tara:strand:+ start:171 stop:611 length:441 start_codon:yes stop_codon:yes gene_type:complete
MYKVEVKNIAEELYVECPACNHQIYLSHSDWSAIICTKCGVELEQEEADMSEVVEFPLVVIAKRNEENMVIMTPTDALLYLNSDHCDDNEIHWVTEGTLECSMQKLIDILICHPSFFPCLDVAIDSTPKDRKINRMLLKAKKQPEN